MSADDEPTPTMPSAFVNQAVRTPAWATPGRIRQHLRAWTDLDDDKLDDAQQRILAALQLDMPQRRAMVGLHVRAALLLGRAISSPLLNIRVDPRVEGREPSALMVMTGVISGLIFIFTMATTALGAKQLISGVIQVMELDLPASEAWVWSWVAGIGIGLYSSFLISRVKRKARELGLEAHDWRSLVQVLGVMLGFPRFQPPSWLFHITLWLGLFVIIDVVTNINGVITWASVEFDRQRQIDAALDLVQVRTGAIRAAYAQVPEQVQQEARDKAQHILDDERGGKGATQAKGEGPIYHAKASLLQRSVDSQTYVQTKVRGRFGERLQDVVIEPFAKRKSFEEEAVAIATSAQTRVAAACDALEASFEQLDASESIPFLQEQVDALLNEKDAASPFAQVVAEHERFNVELGGLVHEYQARLDDLVRVAQVFGNYRNLKAGIVDDIQIPEVTIETGTINLNELVVRQGWGLVLEEVDANLPRAVAIGVFALIAAFLVSYFDLVLAWSLGLRRQWQRGWKAVDTNRRYREELQLALEQVWAEPFRGRPGAWMRWGCMYEIPQDDLNRSILRVFDHYLEQREEHDQSWALEAAWARQSCTGSGLQAQRDYDAIGRAYFSLDGAEQWLRLLVKEIARADLFQTGDHHGRAYVPDEDAVRRELNVKLAGNALEALRAKVDGFLDEAATGELDPTQLAGRYEDLLEAFNDLRRKHPDRIGDDAARLEQAFEDKIEHTLKPAIEEELRRQREEALQAELESSTQMLQQQLSQAPTVLQEGFSSFEAAAREVISDAEAAAERAEESQAEGLRQTAHGVRRQVEALRALTELRRNALRREKVLKRRKRVRKQIQAVRTWATSRTDGLPRRQRAQRLLKLLHEAQAAEGLDTDGVLRDLEDLPLDREQLATLVHGVQQMAYVAPKQRDALWEDWVDLIDQVINQGTDEP